MALKIACAWENWAQELGRVVPKCSCQTCNQMSMRTVHNVCVRVRSVLGVEKENPSCVTHVRTTNNSSICLELLELTPLSKSLGGFEGCGGEADKEEEGIHWIGGPLGPLTEIGEN